MSLAISSNFRNDSSSKNTQLIPIVDIGGSIYISTNDITFNNKDYKPLLLGIPSLKESIDLDTRKYKISSINIDISNMEHGGVRFSDIVSTESLINTYAKMYWIGPSCASGDEFLVFDGIIRQYDHSSDNVKLIVEDSTQALINKPLPSNNLGIEPSIPDKYKNKPYPMVYGHVKRSPCVLKVDTLPDVPDYSQLRNIVADKMSIKSFEEVRSNLPLHGDLDVYGSLFIGEQGLGYAPCARTFGYSLNSVVFYSDLPMVSEENENYTYIEETATININTDYDNDASRGVFRGIVPRVANDVKQDSNISTDDSAYVAIQNHDTTQYAGTIDYLGSLSFQTGDDWLDDISVNLALNRIINNDIDSGLHLGNAFATNDGSDFHSVKIELVQSSCGFDSDIYFIGAYFQLAGVDEDFSGQPQNWPNVWSWLDYELLSDPIPNLVLGAEWFNNTNMGSDASVDNPFTKRLNQNGTPSSTLDFNLGVTNYDTGTSVKDLTVNIDIWSANIFHVTYVDKLVDRAFYANVKGRMDDTDTMVESFPNIVSHIMKHELDHTDIPVASQTDNIKYAFTVNQHIDSKKLIEEIASASRYVTYFNNRGDFKFHKIKDTYGEGDLASDDSNVVSPNKKILEEDVIDFSFSRTRIEDVCTKVIFKYDWDYARKEFSNSLELSIADLGASIEEYHYYGFGDSWNTDAEQGGISNSTTVIDDHRGKYIRTQESAAKFADWYLMQHRNQHLKIKVKLPLKYLDLEIADVIKFDKILGGIKPYGINYEIDDSINEQDVYRYFTITSTNKTIDHIVIECIQMHNLDSGHQGVGCMDTNACNYNPDAYSACTDCCNYFVACDGLCFSSEADAVAAGSYPDCLGVCGGDTHTDLCGICGGDDTTCHDCTGVPGNAVVDECGECEGNGPDNCGVCFGNCWGPEDSECPNEEGNFVLNCEGLCLPGVAIDCLGECGGSAVIDDCGICGGDNSTCQDCNGIPNGNALLDCQETCCGGPGLPDCIWADRCGVCGGNGCYQQECDTYPSNMIDCNGNCVEGSHSIDCSPDEETCSTHPNSSNDSLDEQWWRWITDYQGTGNGKCCIHDSFAHELDGCGNCPPTTDDACYDGDIDCGCNDCFGFPNGTAEYNTCGVCDGDGSCIDCGNALALNYSDECDFEECECPGGGEHCCHWPVGWQSPASYCYGFDGNWQQPTIEDTFGMSYSEWISDPLHFNMQDYPEGSSYSEQTGGLWNHVVSAYSNCMENGGTWPNCQPIIINGPQCTPTGDVPPVVIPTIYFGNFLGEGDDLQSQFNPDQSICALGVRADQHQFNDLAPDANQQDIDFPLFWSGNLIPMNTTHADGDAFKEEFYATKNAMTTNTSFTFNYINPGNPDAVGNYVPIGGCKYQNHGYLPYGTEATTNLDAAKLDISSLEVFQKMFDVDNGSENFFLGGEYGRGRSLDWGWIFKAHGGWVDDVQSTHPGYRIKNISMEMYEPHYPLVDHWPPYSTGGAWGSFDNTELGSYALNQFEFYGSRCPYEMFWQNQNGSWGGILGWPWFDFLGENNADWFFEHDWNTESPQLSLDICPNQSIDNWFPTPPTNMSSPTYNEFKYVPQLIDWGNDEIHDDFAGEWEDYWEEEQNWEDSTVISETIGPASPGGNDTYHGVASPELTALGNAIRSEAYGRFTATLLFKLRYTYYKNCNPSIVEEGNNCGDFEADVEKYYMVTLVYDSDYSDCNEVPGDVNGDGNVNVLDVVTLANCVLTSTCEGNQQADVNGDGNYNVLDIVTLVQMILD